MSQSDCFYRQAMDSETKKLVMNWSVSLLGFGTRKFTTLYLGLRGEEVAAETKKFWWVPGYFTLMHEINTLWNGFKNYQFYYPPILRHYDLRLALSLVTNTYLCFMRASTHQYVWNTPLTHAVIILKLRWKRSSKEIDLLGHVWLLCTQQLLLKQDTLAWTNKTFSVELYVLNYCIEIFKSIVLTWGFICICATVL